MTRDPGKLVAAMIGVGLCVLALGVWRLPTGGSRPGLDLRLIVSPPGELTVEPAGVIASARAMQAGDSAARGGIRVQNITGRSLLVWPVALASVSGLAREVRLRAVAGEKTIASGTLASLARPHGAGIRLPPRGSGRIGITSWIGPDASGYRGRILDVTLELRTRAIETRG